MKSHPDQQYLIALKAGDAKLIKEIYRLNALPITKWIQKNNGTTEDAKDVFQEAMEVLLKMAIHTEFKLTCPLSGLLFKICRNKWIDRLKSKDKEIRVRIMESERYIVEEATTKNVYEKMTDLTERQTHLQACFVQLSETCRQLLQLTIEEKKTTEILTALKMDKASTLYRRKNACINRWKELYQSIYVKPI